MWNNKKSQASRQQVEVVYIKFSLTALNNISQFPELNTFHYRVLIIKFNFEVINNRNYYTTRRLYNDNNKKDFISALSKINWVIVYFLNNEYVVSVRKIKPERSMKVSLELSKKYQYETKHRTEQKYVLKE